MRKNRKEIEVIKELLPDNPIGDKSNEEELEEEKDYRISVVNKTEKQLKAEEKAKKKERKRKRKQQETKIKNKEKEEKEDIFIDSNDISSNYVVIRKEVDGLAPIHKLKFLDKIKVVLRYKSIKSGKAQRREQEAIRRQQLKTMKAQSAIRRNLNKNLEKLVDKKVKEVLLEIKVPQKDIGQIDKVLAGNSFNRFNIEELKINKNYLKYGINVPRLFRFRLK